MEYTLPSVLTLLQLIKITFSDFNMEALYKRVFIGVRRVAQWTGSNPTAVSMSLCPWDTSPQIARVGIAHSIEYVSRFG